MKTKWISIPALMLAVFLGSCGADFSRQMNYDYDRALEEKSPSGGGKVQYTDYETGYIRDRTPEELEVYELEKGTNLNTENVKSPMPRNEQERNTNPRPHVMP